MPRKVFEPNMILDIDIDIDSREFERPVDEIAAILVGVIEDLRSGICASSLLDSNGNTVGGFDLDHEDSYAG
jgi:hypothetical protein